MAPTNRKHKAAMSERAEKRQNRYEEQARSAPPRDDADDDDDDDDDDEQHPANSRRPKRSKGYFGNIKWKHVGLLLLMTGTAVLPAVLWVADKASGMLGSSNAFKKVGIQCVAVRPPSLSRDSNLDPLCAAGWGWCRRRKSAF